MLKKQVRLIGGINFGDSNRIVMGFHPEEGLIKMVAHGIRKIPNKYGADLEFLNQVEVVLSQSSKKNTDLFTIKEHILLDSTHTLRQNAKLLMFWYYLVEFLMPFIKQTHTIQPVYDIFEATLQVSRTIKHDGYALIRSSQLNIIDSLGYLPDLTYCSKCQQQFKDQVWVSHDMGWFVCSFCKQEKTDIPLPKTTWQVLVRFVEEPLDQFIDMNIDKTMRGDLNLVFNRIVYSLLGKPLSTEKLLKA